MEEHVFALGVHQNGLLEERSVLEGTPGHLPAVSVATCAAQQAWVAAGGTCQRAFVNK